jgi:hypothetical protein
MSENNNTLKSNRRGRGYLNPDKVKAFAFIIITLCILLGVVVSILAIWDFAEKNVLYRTLATLAVVSLGCLLFSIVNERFGNE